MRRLDCVYFNFVLPLLLFACLLSFASRANASSSASKNATTLAIVANGSKNETVVAVANALATTSPLAQPANPITTTRRPLLQSIKLPCSCNEGQCGCCSGMLLDRFKQKACMNLTYDADETAVTAAMSMNERVLYKNTFSGKNPEPMCISVPRFRFIEFCVEFSNIYLAKRNIHMCVDAEASWEDFTLVEWSFDCLRLGASGFAVLGPEDGGGLPLPGVDVVDQVDEDYDDNARNNVPSKSDKFTVEKMPDGYVKFNFNKI